MRNLVTRLIIALTALSVGPLVAHAQLSLTRTGSEIVVTSDVAPTWRIVLAVEVHADRDNPGGGMVRALHIPATNQESIVGPDPGQFCCAGLGLDNLEWRYVDDGKGVRAPSGTDAKIETLEFTRQSAQEIVIHHRQLEKCTSFRAHRHNHSAGLPHAP
jgi:hypothetical protein